MGKFVLNTTAVANAKKLISQGKIDTGEWDFNWARDVKDPEEFGRNYCLGHLKEGDPATKAYWGYPFGKNGKVYRKSLASIMGYAAKNGEDDIYKAAQNLAKLADEKLGKTTEQVTGDFIRLEGKARYKHKLLNIGKKNYHGQEWDVTYDYLKKLVDNTKKALGLGVEVPVTVSHPKTTKDYTDNKVGNLVDLEIKDTWLWGIFEIDDPEAVEKIESGVWDKVSIGIVEHPMETLLGEKIEPPYVDHVAITAINAVPDQGAFIKLEQQITKLLENIKGLLGFKKEVEQEAPQDSKKQEEENNMDEKNTKQLEEIKKLRAELEKARKELSERRRKEFEARVEKYIKEKKLTPAVKEDVILLFDYLEKKTDVITLENDKELTVLDLFVKVLDNLPKIDYIEGQKIANPLQAKELSKEDKEKIARKLAGVE